MPVASLLPEEPSTQPLLRLLLLSYDFRLNVGELVQSLLEAVFVVLRSRSVVVAFVVVMLSLPVVGLFVVRVLSCLVSWVFVASSFVELDGQVVLEDQVVVVHEVVVDQEEVVVDQEVVVEVVIDVREEVEVEVVGPAVQEDLGSPRLSMLHLYTRNFRNNNFIK